jgi:hypothetical protein
MTNSEFNPGFLGIVVLLFIRDQSLPVKNAGVMTTPAPHSNPEA